MRKRPLSTLWGPSILLCGALLLGACSNGTDPEPADPGAPAPADTATQPDTDTGTDATDATPPAGEGGSITFWTPQTTPERLAVQEKLGADFEAATGISVQVVPMTGADQNQALVTGAASGDVPDVILHAPDQTAAWNAQGLLDTAVATQVVESLGRDTFSEASLNFATLDDQIAAVPSDGWTHLIVYRTDLFEAAGIEMPTSLEELADAAETMKDTGITGIALFSQPGTPQSTESTESILLAAGCQMFDNGAVTIDSPECIEGLTQFKRLKDTSLAGEFDVPAARAAYLNGDAAMLIFSTHILDELAGLDPDNPVTCPECADNPRFLAENSGFITTLNQENPAQYGTVLNYGVPTGANAEAAGQFIEFLLTDGYIENLGMATEGRIPVRSGNTEDAELYITEWGQLPFGLASGTEQSIADVYGQETVDALRDGVAAVQRWGFGTPDAAVAGAVFAQGTVSAQLEQLYAGTDPAEVAATIRQEIEQLQAEFGG